jgi:hypothetical protein
LRPLRANPTTFEFTTTAPALLLARAFFLSEENIFIFKTHQATRGVVNFHSAGVVTHDRWIGPCFLSFLFVEVIISALDETFCTTVSNSPHLKTFLRFFGKMDH